MKDLPMLTSPLLLYSVPRCDPDSERKVYIFGKYGIKSVDNNYSK